MQESGSRGKRSGAYLSERPPVCHGCKAASQAAATPTLDQHLQGKTKTISVLSDMSPSKEEKTRPLNSERLQNNKRTIRPVVRGCSPSWPSQQLIRNVSFLATTAALRRIASWSPLGEERHHPGGSKCDRNYGGNIILSDWREQRPVGSFRSLASTNTPPNESSSAQPTPFLEAFLRCHSAPRFLRGFPSRGLTETLYQPCV